MTTAKKIPDYSVLVRWSDEDGEFVATIPEIPHISGLAPTREKAVRVCLEAASMVVESLEDEGRPLPEPNKVVPYSGQLRLRMPRHLHEQLAVFAQQEGMSLNSYIVYLLTRESTAAERTARPRARASALKRKPALAKRLAKTG